jgi:acetylornithine deacetylase
MPVEVFALMDLTSALNPEAIFATLADLIAINSVNPNYPGGPGEAALSAYVGEFFRKNSIPFEVQPVFSDRSNIIARLGGGDGGRTLVLEAHMDTASEQGMSVDPFRPAREGNLMYGRGSCDTKGGLAAMMHALKLLKDLRLRPDASVILAATVDEEYSFRGVLKFLENGVAADGAIVAEPTELETVVASKGCLRWRLRARGRTAHSSKPHLGVNAICKMAHVIVALEERFSLSASRKHPLLGSPTLNVGVIQGGIQVNQVPEFCVIEVDRRVLPGETREEIQQQFADLLGELQQTDPALDIEMESPMLEDFPLETSDKARIVQVATEVCQLMHRPCRLVGVPFASDASKIARAGIPSIIWGPGNIDRAHARDEYVELDQVVLATELYARTILAF